MKAWLADRPTIVAILALLAPVLLGGAGAGLAGLLPTPHVSVPRVSDGLPFMSQPNLPPPPSMAPAPPDQVVPPGRPQVRVPILEYHYVRVNPDPRDRLGFNLSVTPPDFKAQMDWLGGNGYHPVDLNDLRAYFKERRPLPSRPVVLTFDDGYLDFYTDAFPVLQQHAFKAVAYIVPRFLEGRNYMTHQEILDIDEAGIEVGAHTMNHVDLTKASAAQLVDQVQGSKAALEQMVGHPVLDFCYPSGQFNATVVANVQQAGFESATTELPGTAHGWGDRLTWTRVRVNGGEILPQFVASLGEPEPTVPGEL